VRKRIITLLLSTLIVCLTFPGCAYLSKSRRQEIAYRNYVRKHALQRQRGTAKAHVKVNREIKAKMKMLPKEKPSITATAETVPGPGSVPLSDTGSGNDQHP
jgi:cytochrome c biogenesis protein ResB